MSDFATQLDPRSPECPPGYKEAATALIKRRYPKPAIHQPMLDQLGLDQ